MSRLLVIQWDAADERWRVIELPSRNVIESFRHIADAGWFVQSQERAA